MTDDNKNDESFDLSDFFGDVPLNNPFFYMFKENKPSDDSMKEVLENLKTQDRNELMMEIFKLESEGEEENSDMVNHPSHYNQGVMETMEKFIMYFSGNPDYIKGAFLYNIMKYSDRSLFKDQQEEDNGKIKFFRDLFIELFPEEASMHQKYIGWKKNK